MVVGTVIVSVKKGLDVHIHSTAGDGESNEG